MPKLFNESILQKGLDHVLPYSEFQLFSDIGGLHIREENYESFCVVLKNMPKFLMKIFLRAYICNLRER